MTSVLAGPFIIMEYDNNSGDIMEVLRKSGQLRGEIAVLDPNIDETKLEYVYDQIADVVLLNKYQ
ncbi:Fc.00g037060.m01.CDS01 [Cosmosporella sp. VM-42]